MLTMTATSMPTRTIIEKNKLSETTLTLLPSLMADHTNHGMGNPIATSKMFEPIEEETAMSPNPWRATITLVKRSGTLVPAARKVSPITSGGIPIAVPTTSAHHTMKYEKIPIHAIARTNVTGNQL
jgi:hypothetical protein